MEPAGGREAAPGRNEVEGGISAARVPRAAQLARDSLDGEEIDDVLQASRKERDVLREDKKDETQERIEKNAKHAGTLGIASRVALIELDKRLQEATDEQHTALLRSLLNSSLRAKEVERVEKDPSRIETRLGQDGAGGWFDFLQSALKLPSYIEKPFEHTRTFHLDQVPGLPLSVFDAMIELICRKPGSIVDLRSPGCAPSYMRNLVARCEDALRAGARITYGTCVTEGRKNLAAYQGCVETVRSWKCLGYFGVYLYHQLPGFASPHQKPFWVLSPDGELAAGSTSANGNDRGGGLGVHTAPSDDAARAAALSEETFDVTIFDVRHPGGEGMQRLAQIHKINRLGRARHGFVWITPGLVGAVVSGPKVERKKPSKKELKRKYQAEHIADLQATARASTFSDADVELAIAQHAFIDASSTTGHVDLTKDATIKSSLPLVPRADKAERDKLQQVISTAFTLMPRTKDKGKQAPTISRSEKRAWRDEAEANSGLTEAQLAEIKRKRQTKPLAAATGYAPNYTPRPKYLPGLRSTSTTLDPIVEEPEASHGSTAPTRSSSAACRLPESRKEDSYTSDHASSTASARQATTTGADQKLQSPAAATDNSAEPRRPLQETFKLPAPTISSRNPSQAKSGAASATSLHQGVDGAGVGQKRPASMAFDKDPSQPRLALEASPSHRIDRSSPLSQQVPSAGGKGSSPSPSKRPRSSTGSPADAKPSAVSVSASPGQKGATEKKKSRPPSANEPTRGNGLAKVKAGLLERRDGEGEEYLCVDCGTSEVTRRVVPGPMGGSLKPIGPDDQWLCEKCRTGREAAKLDHSQMIARGFDKTDDPTIDTAEIRSFLFAHLQGSARKGLGRAKSRSTLTSQLVAANYTLQDVQQWKAKGGS